MLPKPLTHEEHYFVIYAIKTALDHAKDSILVLPGGKKFGKGDFERIADGVTAAIAAQKQLHVLLVSKRV